FRMVAILTGSKNALKGVGFFLGSALLAALDYDGALWVMVAALGATVLLLVVMLNEDIGKSKRKPKLTSLLSKSDAINKLSFARFFLFGSRDIWFVVAVPVFLAEQLNEIAHHRWTGRGRESCHTVVGPGVGGGVRSDCRSCHRRVGCDAGRRRRIDRLRCRLRRELVVAFVLGARVR
ncbi:MAG: hypothetical protein ACO3QU_06650, partial [Ilumatobacteraceae bacterium]